MISMTWPQAIRHELQFNGRVIRLPPQLHEIMLRLLLAPPDTTTPWTDLGETAAMHDAVGKLRHIYGLPIATDWGRGVYLHPRFRYTRTP